MSVNHFFKKAKRTVPLNIGLILQSLSVSTLNHNLAKMKRISSMLFIGAFLIISSCSPTESVFKDHKISLTVDAEVIETWITL